jgi:hypothetical protein
MKEYDIEYTNIYILVSVLMSTIVLLSLLMVFVAGNKPFGMIVFIICLLALLVPITNCCIKLFKKEMRIIIFKDYFDINNGEKTIYFKNIQELKWGASLSASRHSDEIIGYRLTIKYNDTEKLRIHILKGNSEKAINNCNLFLEFHNEIDIKYKEYNGIIVNQ